jgi:asparagine synthase (glutamine-hydrolysing)
MSDVIVHRSPDDTGLAALPAEGIALAMRRLSILDLEGGRQPMWDEHRRILRRLQRRDLQLPEPGR